MSSSSSEPMDSIQRLKARAKRIMGGVEEISEKNSEDRIGSSNDAPSPQAGTSKMLHCSGSM